MPLLLSSFLVCQKLLLSCKILSLVHGRTPILRERTMNKRTIVLKAIPLKASNFINRTVQ